MQKMSMPVITLSPASKTAAPPPPPPTVKNAREASFSSYLDRAEETFVLKLGSSPSPPLTPSHRIHFTPVDKEIDVFDAKKYFNDGFDFNSKVVCAKKDDLPQQQRRQPLSIRSESSWNSRSALLRNVSRKKASKKGLLASIGCNCACADKNSVDIDEEPELRVPHIGRFNFPVFNPTEDPDKRRSRSRRVFGSPIANQKSKFSMVAWDAIAPPSPPDQDLKIPSISMHDDGSDGDSDASSDLFEIESLYIDNPCMTPATTCYAPSEASVEWSVVTASAADFAILSDSDEVVSTVSKTAPPKTRPSILSGCRSHKSVSVAGDAHARRHVTPLTRFHDESKLSFDAKTRQNSFDARIVSQPRSASAVMFNI